MKFVVIIAIVATIGIMFVSLGTSEAFATDFKDKNYTPKWAKPQTEKQTLDFCSILAYSAEPSSSDVKWCKSFTNHYNKKINSPIVADSKKAVEAKKVADAKKVDDAKKMEPKMLIVNLNDLDSYYKLKDTDYEIKIGESIVIDSFAHHSFANPMSDLLLHTIIYQFVENKFSIAVYDSSKIIENEDQYVYEFKLSKQEKCFVAHTMIECISGKYLFITITDSKEESFKLMDIMLKKYYKAQGKEFKQSTKQLFTKVS